jgi:60S ribosomal subunit assembly/export protein LOC1
MTIMALVNAEKEGQIESKMIKMRRMEEIRDARRVEAEKREEERRGKLEGVKRALKKRGRPVSDDGGGGQDGELLVAKRRHEARKDGRKRVAFA